MLVNRGSPRRWRASFIAATVTAFGLNVGASSRVALRVLATLTDLELATWVRAAATLISFIGLTFYMGAGELHLRRPPFGLKA